MLSLKQKIEVIFYFCFIMNIHKSFACGPRQPTTVNQQNVEAITDFYYLPYEPPKQWHTPLKILKMPSMEACLSMCTLDVNCVGATVESQPGLKSRICLTANSACFQVNPHLNIVLNSTLWKTWIQEVSNF